MKKFLEKKILVKSILIFLVICIMIPMGIVCFQYATTLSYERISEYAVKKSEVNSQNFEISPLMLDGRGTEYEYAVSEDASCDNELFIFKRTNTWLDTVRFKKPQVRVSSEKEVSSLQISVPLVYDDSFEDTYLVYYSNNESRIKKCIYEYTEDGETYTFEKSIPSRFPFAFSIPLIANHENERREIIKASFYDETGNLVFEDIP